MNLIESIKILKLHNKWRRGDDTIPITNPKKLGISIDLIVEELENRLKTDFNNN